LFIAFCIQKNATFAILLSLNNTIMAQVAGITFEKNTQGLPIYMRIDMRKFGNNPFIEDFIDSQMVEMREDEELVPWEKVKKKLDKKHKICTKSL